ncbi:Hypothetical predicted protein [Pelobates cultripes]|uniref:SH2 domain-containing protein n=1 Tax=Pelobates cultripes TaxID=61616 RepID=A0AAD1S857_PELCU|nr:Hypothetical predicted protein [Pelobates cultripes]
MEAETLLSHNVPGSFLIRVGESRIGYSLSYRTEDHYRHFMIDVTEGHKCHISGDTTIHKSLEDLVTCHMHYPILPYNEILFHPCGQKTNSTTDYHELFEHRKSEIASLQNRTNGMQVKPLLPVKKKSGLHGIATRNSPGTNTENMCPPLPPRRNKSVDCIPQAPNIQALPPQAVMRLYPCLPQEIPFVPNGFVPILTNEQVHASTSNNGQSRFPPNPSAVTGFTTSAAISTPQYNGSEAIATQSANQSIATRIKQLNFGHIMPMGQLKPQNNAEKIIPEEYKPPPPFAPGF